MSSRIGKQISVAVLLTCFNRRNQTLECLKALHNQVLTENVKFQVYLVDDASTDDTALAVVQAYPAVQVISGTGQLFWTGGMRLAYSKASLNQHDYYLWLNDDTILYQNALANLLDTAQSLSQKGFAKSIIVGSTQSAQTGERTYGGVSRTTWLAPCRFKRIEPSSEPIACDTMNGNCVLIPREVAETVGDLEPFFRHYGADFDYGLRAKNLGCSVWVAPHYVGTCSYNDPKVRMRRENLKQQLLQLEQPKGVPADDVILHPFWEWKEFTKRHAGILWPIYWLVPYRRLPWIQFRNFLSNRTASKSS